MAVKNNRFSVGVTSSISIVRAHRCCGLRRRRFRRSVGDFRDEKILDSRGRKPRSAASRIRQTGASAPGYYSDLKMRTIFPKTLCREMAAEIVRQEDASLAHDASRRCSCVALALMINLPGLGKRSTFALALPHPCSISIHRYITLHAQQHRFSSDGKDHSR
jgi:hypothetical protein